MQAAIRLLQLTIKSIPVENGFYYQFQSQLRATQQLTLANVSEILQATNALSNIKVKSGMEDGFNPKYACGQFFRKTVARYIK